jgi:hypothetical protein
MARLLQPSELVTFADGDPKNCKPSNILVFSDASALASWVGSQHGPVIGKLSGLSRRQSSSNYAKAETLGVLLGADAAGRLSDAAATLLEAAVKEAGIPNSKSIYAAIWAAQDPSRKIADYAHGGGRLFCLLGVDGRLDKLIAALSPNRSPALLPCARPAIFP